LNVFSYLSLFIGNTLSSISYKDSQERNILAKLWIEYTHFFDESERMDIEKSRMELKGIKEI